MAEGVDVGIVGLNIVRLRPRVYALGLKPCCGLARCHGTDSKAVGKLI